MGLLKKEADSENQVPLISIIEKKRLKFIERVFEALDFKWVFIIWIIIIVFFGLGYYLLSSDTTYLVSVSGDKVTGIFENIYFSFMTATSTGLGDVRPVGGHERFLAVIEVILGLTLFAVVTSKLVSIKQETILKEIYEISFSERVNRLKSSLYLFRVDINRFSSKIEEGIIKKREINDLWATFSSFETSLEEISLLMNKSNDKTVFILELDPLKKELLINSVRMSLTKIVDLIEQMNSHDIEWKRDITLRTLESVTKITDRLTKPSKKDDEKAKSLLEANETLKDAMARSVMKEKKEEVKV